MIAVDQATGKLQTPSVGESGETKVVLYAYDGSTLRPVKVGADGTLAVSATVEPPEGGATSALQEAQILQMGAGLPAALTAGGGVKVGLVDATPPGTNTIGAVTGPDAAPLATDNTLSTLSAKLPAAASPADNIANPSVSAVMALAMGWNPALSQWGRPRIDSSNYYQVRAHPVAPSSTSRSTGLQIQRTAAAFSCNPKVLRAWAAEAGFVALFNKASAAADGDVPHGGHVYKVAAGETIVHEFAYNESFTTGLVVAHLSQVVSGGAIATVLHTSAHCLFTVQFD